MVMAALLFVNEFLGWVKLRDINIHGKTWNTVNHSRVRVYTAHPISYWKDALKTMEDEKKLIELNVWKKNFVEIQIQKKL